MKKTAILLSASIILLSSCMKMGHTRHATTQSINATINSDQSYTLGLAVGANARITSQATHAGSSTIMVNSTGDEIYTYTPATNYSGTDDITVTTNPAENQQHSCMNNNNSNDPATYHIHITVNNVSK